VGRSSKDGMHDRGLGVGWRQLMPVSSCVGKATDVVRYLPRADVALPMPTWHLGDHGTKKKKKKKACSRRLFEKLFM
jgi:hypothetical protein